MELHEFIRETITQINKGVKEAQEDGVEYGAIVSPREIANSPLHCDINDKKTAIQNVITQNTPKQLRSVVSNRNKYTFQSFRYWSDQAFLTDCTDHNHEGINLLRMNA